MITMHIPRAEPRPILILLLPIVVHVHVTTGVTVPDTEAMLPKLVLGL